MKENNQYNTKFRSILKWFVLVLCGTQFPKVFRVLSLTSPAWHGLGVFIGLLIGYWIPPIDRSINFKKWIFVSVFLGLIGWVLSIFQYL